MPHLTSSASHECIRTAYQNQTQFPEATHGNMRQRNDVFRAPVDKFIAEQSPQQPYKGALRLIKAAILIERPEVNKHTATSNVVFAVKDAMEAAYSDFAALCEVIQSTDEQVGQGGPLQAMLNAQETALLSTVPASAHSAMRNVFLTMRDVTRHIPMHILTATCTYAYTTEAQRSLQIEMEKQPDIRKLSEIVLPAMPHLITNILDQLRESGGNWQAIVHPQADAEKTALAQEVLDLLGFGSALDAVGTAIGFPMRREIVERAFIPIIIDASEACNIQRGMAFLKREDVRAFVEAQPQHLAKRQELVGECLKQAILQAVLSLQLEEDARNRQAESNS